MKRFLLTLAICLAFVKAGAAQQSAADAPATKEDVQKYLGVVHSREMMAQMVEAMSKPMHQMVHQQYMKDKDKLPADFEARMNKMMDDTMKAFPWDEMLQSMVPVYQKHFTKGDVARVTGHHGRSHAVHDAGVAKANGHDDGASARTSGADAERFQSKTRRKVTSHTQLTNTTEVVP